MRAIVPLIVVLSAAPAWAQAHRNVYRITTADNPVTEVAAAPNGATIYFAAGTYTIASGSPIATKPGQRLVGEGAIIDGGKTLTGATVDGSQWRYDNQTQGNGSPVQPDTNCESGFEFCIYPEDVFYDGSPMTQVGSQVEATAGKFYFDYVNDQIFIGSDPSGHLVETSVAGRAFLIEGDHGAEIMGFEVKHFANEAQQGAIKVNGSHYVTVKDNTVHYNHGVGVDWGSSNGGWLSHNTVSNNGHDGLSGFQPVDLTIQNNTVNSNNYARYLQSWEAGGCKFVESDRIRFIDNTFNSNAGKGIWLDNDNADALISGNTTSSNEGSGIFTEISCETTITGNTVQNNGSQGIICDATPNCVITSNTLSGNGGSGSGEAQLVFRDPAHAGGACDAPCDCSVRTVAGSSATGNNITAATGDGDYATIVFWDTGETVLTSGDLTINNNTYDLTAAGSTPWRFGEGGGSTPINDATWTASFDGTSTLNR